MPKWRSPTFLKGHLWRGKSRETGLAWLDWISLPMMRAKAATKSSISEAMKRWKGERKGGGRSHRRAVMGEARGAERETRSNVGARQVSPTASSYNIRGDEGWMK